VSVLPFDVHQLALAIDVDLEWERVGVLQCGADLYRTLITGSCRNDWIDVRAATCEAMWVNA
jgi:hypothetical protein